MRDYLKPCPFCGRDIKFVRTILGDYLIVHDIPSLGICPLAGGHTIQADNDYTAAKLWNSRADK